MQKSTLTACTFSTLAHNFLECEKTKSTLDLLTAKGAQALAFNLKGATIADLNAGLIAAKKIVPDSKVKGFDQLLRRHVLPVLAQENGKPFFLYNASKGKKGSFSTFHDKPETNKGKANPKQLTATGKAPLPSMETSATISDLASALPKISLYQSIVNGLIAGEITVNDLNTIAENYSAGSAEKVRTSAAAIAKRASDKKAQRKAGKVAGIMADAMEHAKAKIAKI